MITAFLKAIFGDVSSNSGYAESPNIPNELKSHFADPDAVALIAKCREYMALGVTGAILGEEYPTYGDGYEIQMKRPHVVSKYGGLEDANRYRSRITVAKYDMSLKNDMFALINSRTKIAGMCVYSEDFGGLERMYDFTDTIMADGWEGHIITTLEREVAREVRAEEARIAKVGYQFPLDLPEQSD